MGLEELNKQTLEIGVNAYRPRWTYIMRFYEMRTQIRRVGNSAGLVIPAILLKEVNVEIGTVIDLTVRDGYFVAKPIRERGAYRSSLTLENLIANYVRLEDELFINPTRNEVIENEQTDNSSRRGPT